MTLDPSSAQPDETTDEDDQAAVTPEGEPSTGGASQPKEWGDPSFTGVPD